MSKLDDLVGLITSEHADKPNYVAMITETCRPFADGIGLLQSVPSEYDITTATGAQLDAIGLIVGVPRGILTDVVGMHFSLDVVGLGLDQAAWQEPTDASTQAVLLSDTFYRLLLQARIMANHWDGSSPAAKALEEKIYSAYGYRVFIQDNGNLSMALGLACDVDATLQLVNDNAANQVTGLPNGSATQTPVAASIGVVGVPAPELIALLANGYLDVKPATVRVEAYFWPAAPGRMFAFDLDNTWFGGFDDGLFSGVKFTAAPSPVMRFGFDKMTLECCGLDSGLI